MDERVSHILVMTKIATLSVSKLKLTNLLWCTILLQNSKLLFTFSIIFDAPVLDIEDRRKFSSITTSTLSILFYCKILCEKNYVWELFRVRE